MLKAGGGYCAQKTILWLFHRMGRRHLGFFNFLRAAAAVGILVVCLRRRACGGWDPTFAQLRA
jgi:hypothetical protein